MAVVRRAGLDLRNNLKHNSYGHINVLRVEVFQLLEKAFEILGAEDIKHLFWECDVVQNLINEIYLYMGLAWPDACIAHTMRTFIFNNKFNFSFPVIRTMFFFLALN